MSGQRGRGRRTAFDDMLAHNWQRFDDLAGGRPAGRSPVARPAPAAAPAPEPAAPSGTAGPGAPDLAGSAVADELDARFGDGWRCEITGLQQDGGEVAVTCRLTLADGRADVSRTARAAIAAAPRIAGRSGGIPFSIAGQGGGTEAAARAAAEAALAACAELV